MVEPEFIWVFSSDFEEDDDLDMIDDILYEVEETYDISQCDESKMISFLRKHNYDIDLLIDAGLNGEFGEFVSLNDDYEAQISSNGKVRVKKVSLTQNKQPEKTSTKVSKKNTNKQAAAQNLEPIQLSFFGTEDSDSTALINRIFGTNESFKIRNREFRYKIFEEFKDYNPTVQNPVFIFNAANISLNSELMLIPQTLIPPNKVVNPDFVKSDYTEATEEEEKEEEINYEQPVNRKAIYVVLNKFDLVPKEQTEKLFNTVSSRIRDIMKCNDIRNYHIIPISTSKDINIFTKGYSFYQGDQFSKLLNFSL